MRMSVVMSPIFFVFFSRSYKFIECSARDNINVSTAFETIANEIVVEQWKHLQESGGGGDEGGNGNLDVGRKQAAAPKKCC